MLKNKALPEDTIAAEMVMLVRKPRVTFCVVYLIGSTKVASTSTQSGGSEFVTIPIG